MLPLLTHEERQRLESGTVLEALIEILLELRDLRRELSDRYYSGVGPG